ncbi:MAG: hypothetical protein QM667_05895 [Asticcacaulis sp.]
MTKRRQLKTTAFSVLTMGAYLAFMPLVAHAQSVASSPAPSSPAPVHRGFPTWSQFPPPPQDIPTAQDIKAQVEDLAVSGEVLKRSVDKIDWELKDPAGMSASMDARIDPVLGAPVTQGVNADAIAALAARLRARAEPPPIAQ